MNDNSTLTEGFDPKNKATWPILCNMHEVAAVLRFKHHRTARALTTKPPENGGLPFVLRGKKRFVNRDDLAAFVGRRHTASPKYHPPDRKKLKNSMTASANSSHGGSRLAQLVATMNKAA